MTTEPLGMKYPLYSSSSVVQCGTAIIRDQKTHHETSTGVNTLRGHAHIGVTSCHLKDSFMIASIYGKEGRS